MFRTWMAACCLAALPLCTPAQTTTPSPFPTRPVRLVVPYAAGGATDFVARLVGERLAKRLGQPVVVDNKPGAAGALGAADVARAPADGSVLLLTITDSQVNNAALFKTLPYDPQKDFAFVTQIVRSPALISANTDLPAKSMDALRRLAARQPASLSYASWGVGGLGHLAGESLNRELKAGMVHVPQKGEGPVVTDLLSKTVSIGLSSVASAKQHVQAGNLVPLAVLGRERSTALPQVPTLRELGFADPLYDTNVWLGVLAPARTPPAVVQRLVAETRAIVAAEDLRSVLVERGFEIMNTTPEQFAAGYKAEFEVITQRIRAFGIEAQ
ncbi:Bug family tripartite tricarboxylate transporter substrate binding protein [Variovorax sp. PBS-H4]|uniref:Bug family tripartite tricarboxylate transporter substrate binding protein n=1 Tax=Variovorax sp. PBS-H4 TaxID=434008 RepID=UPI001E641DCA|nr:tripartite tricarboxylate transporter substrate-binding protein [Variovorax sp. PBS-H4]